MRLVGERAYLLQAPDTCQTLRYWEGKTVHCVAGIGNPDRFFAQLRALGLVVVGHTFPDHHDFQAEDVKFDDELPVMMTEKDAIKCRGFAQPNHWVVPVDVQLDAPCEQRLQALLARVLRPSDGEGH